MATKRHHVPRAPLLRSFIPQPYNDIRLKETAPPAASLNQTSPNIYTALVDRRVHARSRIFFRFIPEYFVNIRDNLTIETSEQ